MMSDSVGHWTTLFLNQDGINFFDSYGVPPDYEFQLLSNKKRTELDQKQDYLKNMLKKYKVIFNNITYQLPNTATCGNHCSFRLYNSHLNDVEYLDFFRENKLVPDEFVADWCFKTLSRHF